MELVQEHRALFGVDVAGSAGIPGHQRGQLAGAMSELLHKAMWETDIQHPDVLQWEHTGDGAMLLLPGRFLGLLFDLAARLDTAIAEHNRHRRPDLKVRIAVELGPVGDTPGFYGPRISHARLLNAPAFKDLLRRCMTERPDGSISTGMIASDHAYTTAFGGDHTELVRQADFAPVTVREKEFTGKAWIKVPGFDARTIAGFAAQQPETPGPAHAERPVTHVTNQVGRDLRGGIQAGTIHGHASFGGRP